MPRKHLLGRLWSGIEPVDRLGDQRAEDQETLSAFLGGPPVEGAKEGRRRDEGGVEVEVRKQQSGRGEGGERKVEGSEPGLEGTEGGPREGLVCAVAGL